jgi:hypothetical protein
MTYQGILKDIDGQPVTNDTLDIIFRIFDVPEFGFPLWVDTMEITTNDGGYFDAKLDNLNLSFNVNYFLELKISGESQEMAPRQVMSMSAYAASADTSEFARQGPTDDDWVIDGVNIYRLNGNVGVGIANPAYKLHVNGNFSASTVNTGQGNFELYAMNQNIQTTDNPTFNRISLTDYGTALGGFHVGSISDPGTGNLVVDGSITGATANTGQGNYELYAMDQNVRTTDNPTFNRINLSDYGTALGGFHIGGTLDPGTDNLIIDGDMAIGSFTFNSHPPHLDILGGVSGDLVIKAGTDPGGNPGASLTFISGADPRAYFSDHRVGIGESNPSNILQIKQNTPLDPIADHWTEYPPRIREVSPTPIENAIDIIQNLNGVTFTWIATGENDIGIIAEELAEALPEAVTIEKGSKKILSVNYTNIIPVLVEAIKKLKSENIELKDRVTGLEKSSK